MAEQRTRGRWLAILAALLIALVGGLVGHAATPKAGVYIHRHMAASSTPASITPVFAAILKDNVTLASAPSSIQATPTPTRRPRQVEVLPPVVSPPAPTGRGLFDEIVDRLLRALLNF